MYTWYIFFKNSSLYWVNYKKKQAYEGQSISYDGLMVWKYVWTNKKK